MHDNCVRLYYEQAHLGERVPDCYVLLDGGAPKGFRVPLRDAVACLDAADGLS